MSKSRSGSRRSQAVLCIAPALCALVIAGALMGEYAPAANAAPALAFIVNSPADNPDVNPGNDVCETVNGNHICTLRAAVQEANSKPGADTIQLQPGVTYLLTQIMSGQFVTAGLVISQPLTILGAGMDSTVIDGNAATLHGRVFALTNTVMISGVTIRNGFSPNDGGGIYNTGRLTLVNSGVLSNTASGTNNRGGGIFSANPMTISSSLIRGNLLVGGNIYGAGVFVQAPLLMRNSTISGNRATGTPGNGGGLYITGFNAGEVSTIIGSTINDNVGVAGGGVYKASGTANFINNTISTNYSGNDGGGFYLASGVASLFNTTVAFNMANADGVGSATGGGIYAKSGSTLNFANSIVALNSRIVDSGGPLDFIEDDDCAGTLSSQGYNLLYDINVGCTVNGSYTQAAPGLDFFLRDNGGPTRTHALLPGSAAIDGGNPGGCVDSVGAPLTTDQRGRQRPALGGLGRCDIGAFEFAYLQFLPLIRR